ncbi:unnamed protein product, partial [Candidula unifasciata]
MLTAIICCTLLLCSAGAELLLTVTPEIVEPGITPFFTLRCSLAEYEEGNIAALALYRRSITAKPGNTTPQLVAEILGTSPTIPSLVPGFEGLTVQGQISPIEEELETYLEVVWPNPTISDLGLYSCEVTVLSETGGVTTLVEARVTSSNAVTDKLLATVLALEEQFNVLNQSVREIYAEIDNITLALDTEIRPAVESYGEVRTVENITEADVTPVRDTPTEEKTLTEDIETAETPSQPSDVELNRITEGLEELKSRLENINDTLGRINVVITSLTER